MCCFSGPRVAQKIWEIEVEPATEKLVYTQGNLEVKVDLNPIGGYRSRIGSLTINHVDHKVFTDWNEDDLEVLSKFTQMILHIQEEAGVTNTLILGRQDEEKEFKLSFVTYPKCNWIEKIQGLLHVIFGSPALKEQEAQAIADFYKDKFVDEEIVSTDQPDVRQGNPDAFCRDSVIDAQSIVDISFDNNRYHVLHDKWPKGASAEDPHFLIVPEGESGHYEGSQFSAEKRFQMLKIAQKTMQVLLQEQKYSTFLFLERNGKDLQGVKHQHDHVIGIQHFPETLLQKISTLLRQLYTPALSHLETRIQHYKQLIEL
jgi:diadenosine tetraphosphate (Ap4A) HIT family hydrolase